MLIRSPEDVGYEGLKQGIGALDGPTISGMFNGLCYCSYVPESYDFLCYLMGGKGWVEGLPGSG